MVSQYLSESRLVISSAYPYFFGEHGLEVMHIDVKEHGNQY